MPEPKVLATRGESGQSRVHGRFFPMIRLMKKTGVWGLCGLFLLVPACRANLTLNAPGGREPLDWKILANFLGPIYEPFRAGGEAEGAVIDWDGFKSSTASRKYFGAEDDPVLEISIVDIGGDPRPESEFLRLYARGKDAQGRLANRQVLSGHPTLSFQDHDHGRTEAVVFVRKRFLVHVLIRDVSRKDDFSLADKIIRELDLTALAALAGE